METNNIIKLQVKKICSTIGLGLFIMAIINSCSQILILELFKKYSPNTSDIIKILVANSIGFYFIGMGTFKFLIRKIPPKKSEYGIAYDFLDMLELTFLSIMAMYVFNFISSFIIILLGIEVTNPVEILIKESGIENLIALFIVTCILAPIFEEILFRKWILDRLKHIGTKPAVFISAILFGFYHMNFAQGLYAFGIGLILAYATVRTGNIKASITIHMIINFIGGILMPTLLGLFPEIVIPNGEKIVTILILWFFVCGVIVFIKKRNHLLDSAELKIVGFEQISFVSVTMNLGMILFFGYCITMAIKSIN